MKTRASPSPASPSPPPSGPKTRSATALADEDSEQKPQISGRFRVRVPNKEELNRENHICVGKAKGHERNEDLRSRECVNGADDDGNDSIKPCGFATRLDRMVLVEGAMENSNHLTQSLQKVASQGGRIYIDGQEDMGGFAMAGRSDEMVQAEGAVEERSNRGCLLAEGVMEKSNRACSPAEGAMERSNRGRSLQEVVSRHARFLQNQQKRQVNAASARTLPVIRWEHFLPQYQLRVLLVEDDDSTRHVVTALLRNCSYEVTSAASGLLAWGLLVAQTCQFDIVLTEVVMSGLSGIGLLSRIMARETLKHIPVVMMSSHDSMGIVFKCLSKGAVDFLVKPVRKNELKNLWQHVWRRCRSSTGSDCGSGSRTQKASHHRPIANDDNSNGSTDNDNTSSEINRRGGSDNGSGTQLQGSWTKRAIEVESSQQTTFGPFLQPTNGIVQYEKGCSSQLERIGRDTLDHASGNDLDKSSLMLVKTEPNFSCDEERGTTGRVAAIGCDKAMPMEDDAGSTQDGSIKAMDLTRKSNGNGEEQQGESADVDVLLENHASNSPSSKEKFASDSSSPSMMERMFNHPSSINIEEKRDREGQTPGLRHSCSSAFSRYNNSSGYHGIKSSDGVPQSVSGHGTQAFQSSVAASTQMQRIMPTEGSEFSTPPPPYLSHGSHLCNNEDNNSMLPSMKDGDITTSCKGDNESSHVQHVSEADKAPLSPGEFHDNAKDQVIPMVHMPDIERVEGDGVYNIAFGQGNPHERSQQIHYHTHHHKHHHHHHVQHHFHYHRKYTTQQRSEMLQIESQTITNAGSSAPKCAPSSSVPGLNNGRSGSSNNNNGNNGQSGSSNDNNGNNGQSGSSNNDNNGSATGSNNGGNGHSNGQSTNILPPLDSGEHMIIQANNRSEEGIEKCLISAAPGPQSCLDPNRSATREAALTKFRQKRKERCFEKKVRYQSRKRLAEQRPRVRGQFVRQTVYDFSVTKPE